MTVIADDSDTNSRIQQPPLHRPIRRRDATEARRRRSGRLHTRRIQRLRRLHRRSQVTQFAHASSIFITETFQVCDRLWRHMQVAFQICKAGSGSHELNILSRRCQQ